MMSVFGASSISPPLVLGSVFGRRLWNWNSTVGVLESPIKRTRWESAVSEAYCHYGARGSISNADMWVAVMKSFIPVGAQYESYEASVNGDDLTFESIISYTIYWEAWFTSQEEYLTFKNSGCRIDYASTFSKDNSIRLAGHVEVSSGAVNQALKRFGVRVHTFQAECACGFYAYFAGNVNEYWSPGFAQVAGIIEGTGETVVGTNGFRSSKARIVAMSPMEGFVGVDHWWGLDGYNPVPSHQKDYNVLPTVELLREKYPDVDVYSDTESMYAAVNTSSVLDFT